MKGNAVLKHGTATLAIAAALVAIAGCMSGVRSPLEHEITKRVTPEKTQFDIEGWTDRTGAHHKLIGSARIVGDSVQFYERRYDGRGDRRPNARLLAAVPRSDVTEVTVAKFDAVKTGILLLTPVVAFYVLVIIAYGSENNN